MIVRAGAFDTVVAVAAFGPGAVDQTAMPEISRLVATGKIMCQRGITPLRQLTRSDLKTKSCYYKAHCTRGVLYNNGIHGNSGKIMQRVGPVS